MKELFSKKWVLISLGVLLLLVVLGGLFWFFGRGTKIGETVAKIFPFGAPGQDISGDGTAGEDPAGGGSGGEEGATPEPMFRQLASVSVAGAYALERDGEQYVRYVGVEKGFTYEVSIKSGVARQLTNSTIPRIQLADWADNGNAVALRYLEKDPVSGRDVVKTNLGHLELPPINSAVGPEEEVALGNLAVDFLPDDIVALSVAPNGKNIFYLVKTGSGVSGSIINMGTRATKEVFRSMFSEWAPQLLNNNDVILTTKPSGGVVGYAYRYNVNTKALERLVREKKGLTMLANASGVRALYGENNSKNISLGVFSSTGFTADEGMVNYENALPVSTLPEKCAWLADGIRALCGSFTTTRGESMPDLWYQGALSLNDTFWAINTDTNEVEFLADPKTVIQQEFDVTSPIVSVNEQYLVFINKKDGTLWSLHVPQKAVADDTTTLSPDELMDAQGSNTQ